MARQIIAEEQPKVETIEQNKTQAKSANGSLNSTFSNDVESTIITSAEMDKLFHEWDIKGHCDLAINPSLAQRIRQYLKYQEELDPLKTELATRIYKPYIVSNAYSGRVMSVILNSTFYAQVMIYKYNDSNTSAYGIISVSHFKIIISALKNPYAAWIHEDSTTKLNLVSYIVDNGGTCDIDSNHDEVNITLCSSH